MDENTPTPGCTDSEEWLASLLRQVSHLTMSQRGQALVDAGIILQGNGQLALLYEAIQKALKASPDKP